MEQERRYGHLSTDDALSKTLYPGVTLAELESRCPWWTDTRPIVLNQIDGSLATRDESAEATARAEAQWEWNVARNIPGFAVSPFPHMFMIHRQPPYSSQWEPLTEGRFHYAPGGDWAPLGKVELELIGDKAKWPTIRVYVNDVFDHSQYRDGWSYEDVVKRVAPNRDPHWFDVPNPRVYWPSGILAYMPCNDRFPIGPWLKTLFKGALVSLWGDATVSNWRTDTLKAFLAYHRTRGGAPERFIDYVESLVLLPPTEFDAVLVEKMREWCQEAQTTKKAPNQASSVSLADLLGEPLTAKLFTAMNEEVDGKRIISTDRKYMLGANSKGAVTASVDAAFAHAGKTPPPDEEYRELLSRTFKDFSLGKGKLHNTRDARAAKQWKPVIVARLKTE